MPEMYDITGRCRNFCDGELYNMYSFQNVLMIRWIRDGDVRQGNKHLGRDTWKEEHFKNGY